VVDIEAPTFVSAAILVQSFLRENKTSGEDDGSKRYLILYSHHTHSTRSTKELNFRRHDWVG
jgi:hypothetical protein